MANHKEITLEMRKPTVMPGPGGRIEITVPGGTCVFSIGLL